MAQETSSKTANLPFPPSLYGIEKLVLTMVPKTLAKGCVYSRLHQFQSSYDFMQNKLLAYLVKEQHGTLESSNTKSIPKQSILTKFLDFEAHGMEGVDREENILDAPVSDTAYADYSFFPEERTLGCASATLDAERGERNEISNTGNLCPSNKQMTLSDLAQKIEERTTILRKSTDNQLWRGIVRVIGEDPA